MNNSFDNIQCEEISRDDECTECGATLVVIQDEYSDAVVCPECECNDWEDQLIMERDGDDDYDGQPSEMDEWLDFDPDC